MITDLCAKFNVNQWRTWLLMRKCPLKYKECPLKRPLCDRIVHSFEIQVAKATNKQKNDSAEESNDAMPLPKFVLVFEAETGNSIGERENMFATML